MIQSWKGKNDQSFIAVDEFAFLQTPVCDFMPPEAVPTEPPTTPEPTEPPSGILKLEWIFFPFLIIIFLMH